MRSLFIAVTFLMVSNTAFADTLACKAQKSVMKYNPEKKQIEVRRAITVEFQVTAAEHEDPKIFDFVDESGVPWGSVQVTTGSHLTNNEKWFFASATVTKADGSIISFLLLKAPKVSSKFESSTLVFDDSEEMPPSLSIICSEASHVGR